MTKRTQFMLVVAALSGATVGAEPPRQARACTDGYGFPTSRTEVAGGYVVSFDLQSAGGYDRLVDQHEGMAVRVVTDEPRRLYAGYAIHVEPAEKKGLFRVHVRPLPENYQIAPGAICRECPPWRSLDARLAKYPAPFELASGGSFRVDLLENPKTGTMLSDVVKIVQGPLPQPDGTRFKVDFDVVPETVGAQRMVNLGFCIRDAATGAALKGIAQPERFPLRRDGRLWRQIGHTNTQGRRWSYDAALNVEGGLRHATYTVTIREGDAVLYAEEVRFPLS